jgi:TetR/AcrR family transcriptional repressor of nem operon
VNDDISPKAAEIMACARSLLATGGYNGFSYADISAAVGISKASIHHHFPSKAVLVETVVRQYREAARGGMATLEKQTPDPGAQLSAYMSYWATCLRDEAAPICICAMLAAELPSIPREVAEEVRRHFEDLSKWLTSVLARGAREGVLHLRGSAKSEAMTLMATVHGAMLAARTYGDPELFRSILQPILKRLSSKD